METIKTHLQNEAHCHRVATNRLIGANGQLVTTPLLPLIASSSCKETKEYLFEHLAKTSHHARQLEALINLWKTLGSPHDGFWPALLVDYNRIA